MQMQIQTDQTRMFAQSENKKRRAQKLTAVGGLAAGGSLAVRQIRRHRMRPIDKIAKEVQRAVGIKVPRTVRPVPLIQKLFIGGHSGSKVITAPSLGARPVRMGRAVKGVMRSGRITNRRVLAHEIAHNLPGLDEAIYPAAKNKKLAGWLQNWKKRPKRLRRIMGAVHGRLHGKEFKSSWRHVEKVMKRTGAWRKLRRLGYTMSESAPKIQFELTKLGRHKIERLRQTGKDQRGRFAPKGKAPRRKSRTVEITCFKCSKVFYRKKPLNWPVRCPTCQALLSKSEVTQYALVRRYRMMQYATGPRETAARDAAKAEGRRARSIAKSTQQAAAVRTKDVARGIRVKQQAVAEAKLAHRLRPTFEGRLVKGVGRFVKRHGALIALLTAAPAIVNEIQQRMRLADQKRAAENYNWEEYAGLGGSRRTIGKLVSRAKRKRRFRKGVMSFPRRHPKTMLVAGGAGLGAWGMQRKQRSDQTDQNYYASTTALARAPSKAVRAASKARYAVKKVGKTVLQTGGRVALGGLISWIALSVLRELEKKRMPAIGPYMPDVRPDIEMARYTIGQVSANVAEIPTAKLYSLQSKALETVAKIKDLPHKVKVGAEKGLLMWLLGFVSAELIGRGITTPKSRVKVEGSVPVRQANYDQPFDPADWTAQNKAFTNETRRMVKGIKRDRRGAAFKRVRRRVGSAASIAIPTMVITSLMLRRKKRKSVEEKYFAAAAAIGGAAKLGKLATAGKWGNRLLTGWIAADLIGAVLPKKKRKLGMTDVQTSPTYRSPQYYAL